MIMSGCFDSRATTHVLSCMDRMEGKASGDKISGDVLSWIATVNCQDCAEVDSHKKTIPHLITACPAACVSLICSRMYLCWASKYVQTASSLGVNSIRILFGYQDRRR